MKLTMSGISEEEFVMYANLDEWVPFAYTIMFNDQTISEVTFGDDTQVLENFFIKEETKKFTRYIVCGSDDCNFQVDNIRVADANAIPEPAVLSLIALALAAFLRRK
jgi:hypothetical protein